MDAKLDQLKTDFDVLDSFSLYPPGSATEKQNQIKAQRIKK
jgi:hypothetical protein